MCGLCGNYNMDSKDDLLMKNGSQAASAAAQQPPSSSSLSASHQHAARLVSHLGAGALPQVRMVSAQPAVGGPQAALLHQTSHQIRVPVSLGTKGLSQVRPLKTRLSVSLGERGGLRWKGWSTPGTKVPSVLPCPVSVATERCVSSCLDGAVADAR